MRVLLTTLFVLLLVTPLLAQDQVPTNPTCPVMVGEPVDAEIFVDYEGKRVWFCCDTCVEDFNADPKKYATKLKKLAKAQLAFDKSMEEWKANEAKLLELKLVEARKSVS